MQLKEMKTLLEFYIDDISDTGTMVTLFNVAKNRMANEVGATFPDIVFDPQMTDSFQFDAKYHELPVLYAAAMYKSADSSINEKNSYLGQFENGLVKFIGSYSPPIELKDNENTQQFTATEGQTDFTVTKNGFYPRFTRMRVYINGHEFHDYRKGHYDTNTIVIPIGITEIHEGDKVTITWEMNDVYTFPPAFYPTGW